MTHRDDFWACKTIRDCNEWMAHEAIREARRLQHALMKHEIRPQTVEHARRQIAAHIAYAREIMQVGGSNVQDR